MPIHFFKTNAVYDLPTEVLLRIWFAQFWRFAVLFIIGLACFFVAAMLTYMLYGIFSDSKPASGNISGGILWGLIPIAAWAWLRAFCSVLNRSYDGWRVTIKPDGE